jgi:hypothetical protein
VIKLYLRLLNGKCTGIAGEFKVCTFKVYNTHKNHVSDSISEKFIRTISELMAC